MPATYLRSAGMGRLTGSVVRPWRLTLLVAGLSMFGPLSIDAILPAFPAMGAGLGADKLAMPQTISVYLLSYALMSKIGRASLRASVCQSVSTLEIAASLNKKK